MWRGHNDRTSVVEEFNLLRYRRYAGDFSGSLRQALQIAERRGYTVTDVALNIDPVLFITARLALLVHELVGHAATPERAISSLTQLLDYPDHYLSSGHILRLFASIALSPISICLPLHGGSSAAHAFTPDPSPDLEIDIAVNGEVVEHWVFAFGKGKPRSPGEHSGSASGRPQFSAN